MANKKKCPLKGAPEWMVTFGDMMSLLLCFFVIIVSLSEIKDKDKFQDVMEEVKRSFGMNKNTSVVEGLATPQNTYVPPKIDVITRTSLKEKGKSIDKGIKGIEESVTKIRDGLEYTLGGLVSFHKGSANLLDDAKILLKSFIGRIKGYTLKIRVKAHAGTEELKKYNTFSDLDGLSFARGMAIKAFFVKNGIKGRRIAVEVVGNNEPIKNYVQDNNQGARNRRVSIIVLEELVKDYQGSPKKTGDITNNG